MSFSAALKTEILENKQLRARFKKAQAYGLFLFAKGFSESSVLVATENYEIFKLYLSFLNDFLAPPESLMTGEKVRNDKTVYTARLDGAGDRKKLLDIFGQTAGVNKELLKGHGNVCAFLSGAYLACGNITDPEKSYHIEFVVKDEALCKDLKSVLDSCLLGAKTTHRRGSCVIYGKEYAYIEDLLTLMGAPKSCLAMIDVEMMKNARNNANRATNCETANIDKMVDAARSQIKDISLVLETAGSESLPEDLQEIAKLRLQNPYMSLKELGGLTSPVLSRSGVFHRLDRISKLAAGIRGKQ
ncbi:MAG: DNA-binding protein WhiA [Oscillospiraceae bacterium]|nr:DNA-binding protein WhiA [Oscillospiraceae bacterium]